ncbi:MAG: DUF721 domain-containing protein [Acidobacteria bacterium]|nr:DUF721 domain-containing protein [Acidobacteriota bacterium]
MIPIERCVAAALHRVLESQPLTPAKVAFAWRLAVGPGLDRATRVSLTDGVLHVRAADEHWRREIHRSAELILSRLERLLGPDAVTKLTIS